MTSLKVSEKRGGLEVTFAPLKPDQLSSVSAVWTIAGWKLQFARIGGDQKLALDQSRKSS